MLINILYSVIHSDIFYFIRTFVIVSKNTIYIVHLFNEIVTYDTLSLYCLHININMISILLFYNQIYTFLNTNFLLYYYYYIILK